MTHECVLHKSSRDCENNVYTNKLVIIQFLSGYRDEISLKISAQLAVEDGLRPRILAHFFW